MGLAESAFQRSFAGGELSPAVATRADLQKYQIGLQTCRNWFVRKSGGVSNRPGLQFVNPVSDPESANVRIECYQSEITGESLLVEVGEEYFRFYQTGGILSIASADAWSNAVNYIAGDIVVSGGTNYYCVLAHINQAPPNATYWYAMPAAILEVPHPFTDVAELRWTQSGRVVTLTHPLVAPHELVCGALRQWVVRPVSTGSGLTVPTINGTPGAAGGFAYNYVATRIDPITGDESGPSNVKTITGALPTPTNPHEVTYGETGYFRVYVDRYSNNTFGYIGDTTNSSFFRDPGIEPDMKITPPIPRTPFNSTGNYPRVSGYHQQRRLFAHTINDPQAIEGSRIGFPSNFDRSSPLQDDDGISFRIVGNQHHPVRHILGLKTLVVMTDGGVWQVGRPLELLTPSDIPADQESYAGVSDVPPVVHGNTVIYVQARKNIVNDLRFAFEVQGFAGQDLTVFAAHLFEGYTIEDIDLALVPHSIIWCVRSDGVLLGLTYLPEQEVFGWHRHDTKGGVILQVCAVPEPGEDAVYVLVRRTIDGDDVHYIERLATRDIQAIEDSFFVDSGLTYSGVAEDTFTGLEHLEGERVSILADGEVVSNGSDDEIYTVVGGTVGPIPTPAEKVHIGLPIQYQDLVMLDLDVDGVVIRDRQKRIPGVSLVIDKSARSFLAGADDTHLVPYRVPTYDTQDSLHHGLVDMNLASRFSNSPRLMIRQLDPLPLTVLGALPRVDVGG